jgi:hypothetical protein
MPGPLPRLPYDRALNADELRGFNMALAELIAWGGRLAAASYAVGAADPVHGLLLQAEKARFLVAMCQSLQGSPERVADLLARGGAQPGPSAPASAPSHRPGTDGCPGRMERMGT